MKAFDQALEGDPPEQTLREKIAEEVWKGIVHAEEGYSLTSGTIKVILAMASGDLVLTNEQIEYLEKILQKRNH